MSVPQPGSFGSRAAAIFFSSSSRPKKGWSEGRLWGISVLRGGGGGGVLRRVVERQVNGARWNAAKGGIAKATGEHHLGALLKDEIVDAAPLQATPVSLVIGFADDDGDQRGMIGVEVRQIEAGVGARDFGLVEFVVEDRAFAETVREQARDFFDKAALFPREGKGDAEAARGIAHGVSRSRARGGAVFA